MKKIISFVFIGILCCTPITFFNIEHSVSAQSVSNYDVAVKQGEKVKAINSLLNSAIKDEDMDMIDTYYDHLATGIKTLEQNIGKVPGATNRTKLTKTYVVPAKVTIERVIYEVSQYRLLYQIAELVGNEEVSKAESNMTKLERLKKKAITIKQAGGYEELPISINSNLRVFEALLQGNILDLRVYPYEEAIDSGKIETMNQLYDHVTKQLKLTQQRIGQVSGAKNRAEMNEYYVTPAKMTIERTIYEISQYRLLNVISNDLIKNDIESAKQRFETLNRLKDRAAKIKEAGGYDSLPVEIEQFLRNKENTLLNQIESQK
ncbi:hypothetical protein [Metabacillus fastidiosus]|uniref:SbsC C-terminal domain-containing protein n=1 Tax=Metabacillus fastidiosus TaxID=1458 RepID=A0ABU6NZA2_9BACI|nr:hypothetical protein [Metabacillus fastidiosus]MED4402449.1 hypothetical protein [Metabacillus fastidiosus]MED4461736.1 hypothetical protein [Metabacillus fastidiosus]